MTNTHTYIHTYMHTYIHQYIHTYIYARACVCVCARAHACRADLCVRMCRRTRMRGNAADRLTISDGGNAH